MAAGEPSGDFDARPARDGIARGRIRRSTPLVRLTTRTFAEAAIAAMRGRHPGQLGEDFHARTADRYSELLGQSKGALMKAGQMISFVPPGQVVQPELQAAYRSAFARLRDDAPPMAPELARQVLVAELGREALNAFAEIDWEPLAAASIGQVHAAYLRDGRAVAVKIQYPGVDQAIRSDLKNGQLLASFVALIVGLLPRRVASDIRAAAREISEQILQELDYRLEAANQAEFASHYRGHPFIHVPDVVPELCSARVLTQELCSGRSWHEALTAPQQLRNLWGETVWRFFYGSYFHFGLLHLDPHPGNFLFHDDGSVSFLDFGCVRRYSQDRVELASEIVRAAVAGDVLTTWRLCVEAGYWQATDPVTPEEVFAYWREPFRYVWDKQPFTVTPAHVARWVEGRCSPVGPSGNAVCHMTMPEEILAWPRVEVSVASLLAGLRATNDWASIFSEYLGELERRRRAPH